MNYFNDFFGIYADPTMLQINFFGKKYIIKRKYFVYQKMSKKKLLIELNKKADALLYGGINEINDIVKNNVATAILHQQTFGPYKNIHNGKEIMLVATGPSGVYRCKIDNAIKIGVNRAILMDDIELDYYFAHDNKAIIQYYDKIINYRPECQKFLGYTREYKRDTTKIVIPEELAIKANAKRYRTDWFRKNDECYCPEFVCDIDKRAICCHSSVIFAAAQFALFTNPKRIYLTGCDCSNEGYWDGTKSIYKLNTNRVLTGWKKFKKFQSIYYPSCEIISINPVGLKGLFKDVYTKSYLEAHPEVDPGKAEITD